MIYLDNAATTQMFESAVDVYKKYACEKFFNPSAGYNKSLEITHEINDVRNLIKKILNVKSGDVIFTGGATESNNLAIMGNKRNGKWEYVFSQGEHPSVYNCAKELELQGYKVIIVPLDKNGEIDYNILKTVVNNRTRLISVIHVSNETGIINDLNKINEIRLNYAPNALLHVDGVQAFSKIPLNIEKFNIDFYTLSAHKFHGPKGVGALYVKNIEKLKNIIFGGGQENGYRSGTENVPGIMALKNAIENIDIEKNWELVSRLNDAFKLELKSFDLDNKISFIKAQSPYILSVSFKGVNGETIMRALQDKNIYVGTGSACSSKKFGNRVLESMGFDKNAIKSHIRVSFDYTQNIEEIKFAAKEIYFTYKDLWEKVK